MVKGVAELRSIIQEDDFMLGYTLYNRIYRISAWYDLLFSWPFATAITLGLWWPLLDQFSRTAGLGGMGTLDVHAVLFANFFGSIVCLWSVLRLRLDRNFLGRYDAAGRVLFSLAMANALSSGAPKLLVIFLVNEIAFAIAQLLPAEMEPSDAALPAGA